MLSAYRLPFIPQHQTFRGLRWTSVVDPQQTFDAKFHSACGLSGMHLALRKLNLQCAQRAVLAASQGRPSHRCCQVIWVPKTMGVVDVIPNCEELRITNSGLVRHQHGRNPVWDSIRLPLFLGTLPRSVAVSVGFREHGYQSPCRAYASFS